MTYSDLPILYSFRRCPYAMRARMALAYCNIKVELREVDLKNKPAQLLQISPKATVPVLVQADGNKLEESLDIIAWALSIQDVDGWLALTKPEQNLTNLLINENDTTFKQYLDKYKYSSGYPQQSEVYYRQQGETFLIKINNMLENNQYLVRDEMSYVDIAIAPFIRQFSNVNINWFRDSKYPLVVQWLDGILGSTIFDQSMQKFPVWKIENEKIIFP